MVATKKRTIKRSKPDAQEEVGLGHFAAICDMTEGEFADHMFKILEDGRMLDLLKPDSAMDLEKWMLERFRVAIGDDGRISDKSIVVMFRLSLNRKRDACLYCVCSLREMHCVEVHHAIPGLVGNVPKEAKGLESFEISFCDLRTS
jgi:hypothetical protein